MSLAQLITQRSLEYAQQLAQPHAEGAMNSRVVIVRYGSQWNAARGEYGAGTPTAVYDDPDDPFVDPANLGAGAPAGITPTQGPIQTSFGDEPEFFDTVNVYVPKGIATLPRINDLVHVIDTPDVQFVGRQFRITSVGAGGRLVPSIPIIATGAAPSRTTES